MELNGVKNSQFKLGHTRLSLSLAKNEGDAQEETISDESGYLMCLCQH